MIKAASLFSSIGIGEYYLSQLGIDVVIANEVVRSRADAHSIIYPECMMINSDITESSTQDSIIEQCLRNNIKLIIATPPCQGVSTVGSNKTADSIFNDKRNYLILSALNIIDAVKPDFFIIENVPRFEKMLFPFNDKLKNLFAILNEKYGQRYNISVDVFNSANFSVPQTRLRIVYRAWRKDKTWIEPVLQRQVTLEEAIGDLPSLEAGQDSGIKNHNARPHPSNHIECMKHTPTGKSAFDNLVYVPRKKDGSQIKGYGNTYKRMRWNAPAPTITMRNEIISSQENVHPGRKIGEDLWSDARVLTLRELLIVSSLPAEMNIPYNLSETTFRQLIGEGIPPLLLKKIMEGVIL